MNVLPQLQRTVVSLYVGWVSVFMIFSVEIEVPVYRTTHEPIPVQ